jgi:hypothetical protein
MGDGQGTVPKSNGQKRGHTFPPGVFSTMKRNGNGALVVTQYGMRQAVKHLEAPDEASALRRVGDLTDEAQENSFELGCVLAQIQANRWFGGYPSFRALVEGEFAVSYRQALSLIAIRNTMYGLKVPPARLLHLGWTKLRTICPVVTPDNVDEWIERAETHTRGDLEKLVAEARGDGKDHSANRNERARPLRRTPDDQLSSNNVVSLYPDRGRSPEDLSERHPNQLDREAVIDRLEGLRTSEVAGIVGEALAARDRSEAVEILTRAAERCGLQATFAPMPPRSVAP